MIKYTLHSATSNLAGYSCRVTVAGKTRHGTAYYKTSAEAEEAARQYCNENKPVLSYKDICGLWTIDADARESLMNLVKSKL